MMPKENEERKKKLFVDDTNKISCLQLVQDESRINSLDNIVHQWLKTQINIKNSR